MQGLTQTEFTDCAMWKATKKLKQVKKPSPPLWTSRCTWARSKAEKSHAFADHSAEVSQPHPSEYEPEEEEALTQLLETPYQLEPPINCLKGAEIQ
jgi:carboxylesterase type B